MKVLVDYGEKKALAALFGVSLVTVRSALADRTKSALAARIRQAALARGGKETEKIVN